MDSISCVLISLSTLISINAGQEPNLCLTMFIIMNTAFYLAHWSVYLTGKLEFNLIDVSEAQIACMLIFIITFCCGGPHFWDTSILSGKLYFPARFVIYFFMLFGSLNLFMAHLKKLNDGGIGPRGSTVASTSVLSPAKPLLVLSCLLIFYLTQLGDVIEDCTVVTCLIFGCCLAKLSNKIIIAHMSKTYLPTFDTIFIAPFIFIVKWLLNDHCQSARILVTNYQMLIFCLAFGVADLVLYLARLYLEIAAYFKIQIFRIKQAPVQEVENAEPEESSPIAENKV